MPGDGDGDETTPSFIIHHHPYNSRNSIRSALRSPDLLDPTGFRDTGYRVAEEDEYDHDDDDDDGVNEGREEDEEAAVVSRVGGILSEEPEEIIEAQEQQEEEGVRAVKGKEVSEATKMIVGEEGKGKHSKK